MKSVTWLAFMRAKPRRHEGPVCMWRPDTGDWKGWDGTRGKCFDVRKFREVLTPLFRSRWQWAKATYAREREAYKERLRGAVAAPVKVMTRKAIREKIIAYTEIDSLSGCWIYQGAWSQSGYGYINISAEIRCKVVTAARAALYAWKGYPHSGAAGFCASRRPICPNSACCNPKHWRFVPTTQNGKIRSRLGRVARGSQNPAARIDEAKAAQIRDALEEGSETVVQIAARLGVTKQTVYHIKQGKSWKHISGEIDMIGGEP